MTRTAKKNKLQGENAKSKYTTSLSPDLRRKSPRGKPIANPITTPGNESSASNPKKRSWGNRGNNGNRPKAPPRKKKNTHPQDANGQNKNIDTKQPSSKQQKQSSTSSPKTTTNATSTTRVTRSNSRQQNKQQDNNINNNESSNDQNNSNNNNNTETSPAKMDTLLVPRKHRIKQVSAMETTLSVLEEEDQDENMVDCPFCMKTICLTNSRVVKRAYKDILKKDKEYNEQPIHNPLADTPLSDVFTLPDNYVQRKLKRPVPVMEQFAFCQLHNMELEGKPKGIELGWPTKVRFGTLKKRISGFKKELDMIIANELDSSYRQKALQEYDRLGQHHARSVMGRMSWFENTMPGYYGMKGASIIQNELARLYLNQDKLGRDVTAPQTGMEYLQQVLLPEVGFRLIREDLIKKDKTRQSDPDIDEQAKAIMFASVSFGIYNHPEDMNGSVSSDEA